MKAIVFEGKVIGCHESAELDGNQVLTDFQTYAGFEEGQVTLVDVSTDMTGMLYADGVFSQPAPEAHATPRRITPEAYFRRFTVFEEAAIRTAAKDNMVLTVLLRRVENAAFVDLDDTDVSVGLDALVKGNFLTSDRADVIQTAPVQPSEALS